MTEQQLQKKIQDYLKERGYVVVKVITANINGVSDILACSPEGRFTAIEVKRPGLLRNVTKLQQVFIDRVNAAGGIAFAADNLNTVKEKLDDTERSDRDLVR